MVINNQRCKYILGPVLHRLYQFGTGYLTTDRHYITINGQVIVQSVSQPVDYPTIKTKGRVTLPPVSVSIIEVKTPKWTITTNLYEINADTFQLPEGIILLDVLHRVDHKTPQHLNIPVLNTNNVPWSIGKNTPFTTIHPVGKCEEAKEVSWNNFQCDTSKVLPQILQNTSLQLETDSNGIASSNPDVGHSEGGQDKALGTARQEIPADNLTECYRQVGPTWSSWTFLWRVHWLCPNHTQSHWSTMSLSVMKSRNWKRQVSSCVVWLIGPAPS